MANSTLANLTASGALTGTELFYSDNGAQDVKVTATQLKAFIVGAGAVSVASGKALTVSNTLTLAGTDGSTLNVGGRHARHGGVREHRHERRHGAAAQRWEYVLRHTNHHPSRQHQCASSLGLQPHRHECAEPSRSLWHAEHQRQPGRDQAQPHEYSERDGEPLR